MIQSINEVTRWLLNTKITYLPRRIVGKFIIYALLSKRQVVIYYSDSEKSRVFDLVSKIKEETNMMLTHHEAYLIFMAVKTTKKVKGDIAEVGVCRGGSAKLICEAKDDKPIHLFDTFEGMPDVDEIDRPKYYEGQFAASLEDVNKRLGGYKNVCLYKGLFPVSSEPVEHKRFSFVHLDVDTYRSTANCLEFFYPRMNQGGIIISHNYPDSAGVAKAFDEFFKDKPEPIFPISDSQCLIVKV